MNSNAQRTSHIEKFNGVDFPFWKKQVTLSLKVIKLNKIVDGTVRCPVQQLNDLGQPLLTQDGIPTQQLAIEEWIDKDVQAQDILFSTIEPGKIFI